MDLKDYEPQYIAYDPESNVIWGKGDSEAEAFYQGIGFIKCYTDIHVKQLLTIEASLNLSRELEYQNGDSILWFIDSQGIAQVKEKDNENS